MPDQGVHTPRSPEVDMPHWFANPLALPLLALPAALGLLALWAAWRRRRALARFGDAASLEVLVEPPGWRRRLRGLCLSMGLTLLALGAAGPQWDRDWQQSAAAPGRDLVVVVDCSGSMRAETPSRLDRAKAALLDLAAALQKAALQKGVGHRVALVAFAARARLLCPLTHDYGFFREKAAALDVDALEPDLGPTADAVSGTRIGAGLHEALLAHDDRSVGARDILLLSDGDDPARDGEWRVGAAEARDAGVPVFAVGLGDPNEPRTLREGGAVVTFEGKAVRTRLEEAPLREIADTTHGAYFAAQTRTLPLGQVYLDAIAGQPNRPESDSDDALPVYKQHYEWFLLAALLLLTVAAVLPDRRPRWLPRRKGRDVKEEPAVDPALVERTTAFVAREEALAADAPRSP
jgi:Ca-activated chloride channel family protein